MADYTIETALFSILSGESTISDIVSARIYPLRAPQGVAMPHMTYQMISADRDHTLDGPTGFTMARFQFNCWAATYPEAKRLLEAVRKFFDGYTGTVNQRRIQCVQSENEGDIINSVAGLDSIDRYGKRFDVIISFDEPTS